MRRKIVGQPAAAPERNTVPLFETKQAMEALRASGHSFTSALGEVVDNSQEANAKNIYIFLEASDPKKKNKLDRVIVIDDGKGMSSKILPMAIGLGSSTRFNSRDGIGRFGVGAILGGISQARRIDYYSKEKGAETFHTYLDFDELASDQRDVVPAQRADFPAEYEEYISNHGTMVVWDKLDLNINGKTVKTLDVDQLEDQVISYVARTYRMFIDSGLKIFVNGTEVEAWDPLFQMESKRFPEHALSELVIDQDVPFTDDEGTEHNIEVRVSLLDEMFRLERTKGDKNKNPLIKQRRIHENEGLSILRNNREIFFGVLPRFFPSGSKEIDRFIGIEIAFSAKLDEYFAVKNIKKGAEPVERLRAQLKEVMEKPIKMLRKRIQQRFDQTDAENAVTEDAHAEAEDAAAEFEKKAPKGDVGADRSPEEVAAAISKAADLVVESGVENVQSRADVERRIKEKPFSVLGAAWPGREFMTIEHLGKSNAIITLNHSHVFFTSVYQPIMRAAGYLDTAEGEESQSLTREDFRTIKNALDLLLVSYAKSEGMDESCVECHERLRQHWGNFLHGMIKELDKNHED